MSSTTPVASSSSNKTTNKEIDFPGGFYCLKEIQRNICFRVYEEINAMGEGRNMNDLYALAYERYHGTGPESLGLAEKFMKGLEMFEGIYEDGIDAASGNHERVLKKILHLKEGANIITDSDERLNGINMKSLKANKKDGKSVIQGRQIWDMGKQVQENGRKVLAIVSRSSKYKEGTVASGEGWEDYLKYCRYKMEKLAKAEREGKNKRKKTKDGSNNILEDDPDDDDGHQQEEEVGEDDEAQLIKDWDGTASFPGYMAWALWGHIPMPGMDPDYKSQLFSAKDLDRKKKTKGGRTASRNTKAKTDNLERASTTVASGPRGLTKKEELLEKQLIKVGDFYDAMEHQGGAEFVRSCINNQLEFFNARLMAVTPLVYSKPDCFTDPDTYQDWIPLLEFKECKQEIARLTNELKEMGEEMKRAMKKKQAAIVALRRRSKQSTTTAASGGTTTGVSTSNNVPGEVIVVDGDDDEEITNDAVLLDDEDEEDDDDHEDNNNNEDDTPSPNSMLVGV